MLCALSAGWEPLAPLLLIAREVYLRGLYGVGFPQLQHLVDMAPAWLEALHIENCCCRPEEVTREGTLKCYWLAEAEELQHYSQPLCRNRWYACWQEASAEDGWRQEASVDGWRQDTIVGTLGRKRKLSIIDRDRDISCYSSCPYCGPLPWYCCACTEYLSHGWQTDAEQAWIDMAIDRSFAQDECNHYSYNGYYSDEYDLPLPDDLKSERTFAREKEARRRVRRKLRTLYSSPRNREMRQRRRMKTKWARENEKEASLDT